MLVNITTFIWLLPLKHCSSDKKNIGRRKMIVFSTDTLVVQEQSVIVSVIFLTAKVIFLRA